MKDNRLIISEYSDRLASSFSSLNKDWIENHFTLEPMDIWQLEHPQEAFLNSGGAILFAVSDGTPVGTVALKPAGNASYELSKMAVSPAHQGCGVGMQLCRAAIEKAKCLGAGSIILYSNRKLAPALHLYEKAGFLEVPLGQVEYSRADIKMELSLPPAPVPWTMRTFDFSGLQAEHYPDIRKKLLAATPAYSTLSGHVPPDRLSGAPEGKWTALQHLGHLIMVEPLWRLRIEEISQGRSEMTPAELTGSFIDDLDFNTSGPADLIRLFDLQRKKTIKCLDGADMTSDKTSLHPLYKIPMRLIDLASIIIAHDDHHLQVVKRLIA
ncbi:GNAT family N-acetyltransferase [Flavobacterium sp. MK4S-17]|uniref:GNAT family N-acetyltransferase n=1 Tax=Flavobacterium sp. MK4S-17 TaxID=2543737 RepID=UPI00135C161D|nr:GNAT family N-acetyltransferase [Flavobacterium sp. MK4S-17]